MAWYAAFDVRSLISANWMKTVVIAKDKLDKVSAFGHSVVQLG